MANPYVAAIGLAVDVGTKLANGRTEDAFGSLNPFASASSEPLTFTVPAGGQVQVEHKLGKVPNGRQIVCQINQGDVWEYQEPDDRYFYMQGEFEGIVVKMLVS